MGEGAGGRAEQERGGHGNERQHDIAASSVSAGVPDHGPAVPGLRGLPHLLLAPAILFVLQEILHRVNI